ncbi:MAG: nucleotidyltransferase family protein [Oligoflexus sp.]
MKALILAAGFGTRLRPLTDYIPKPLSPFFGIPLFDLAFWRIQKAGIESIACNSHYLSEKIDFHLKNSPLLGGRSIQHSYEPNIRGTGGCLYPLKDWLGKLDDILIYNGDILSDINIGKICQSHREEACDATMILLADAQADKTPVYIDNNQNILQFGGRAPAASSCHTFTGIHIISADFAAQIPNEVPWSIIDTYQSRIKAGKKIKAWVLPKNAIWHDLGTPFAYWQAHENILNDYEQTVLDRLGLSDCYHSYGYTLDYQSDQSSLINRKSKQHVHTKQIYKSIILSEECHIPEHVQLDHCLVLPGVQSVEQSSSHSIISAYTQLSFG